MHPTPAEPRADTDRWLRGGLAGGARRIVVALALIGFAAPDLQALTVLKSASLAPYEATVAAFAAAYRGPITVLTLDDRDPDGFANRLAASRPDVIVAVGLKAALFARDHVPRVPLVFCVVPNFERFDLVGSSITGVSTDVPVDREIAALLATAPAVRRIGMLYGTGGGDALARRARAAAQAEGVSLIAAPVAGVSELERVAHALVDQVDALWIPADPTVATPEAFRFLLQLSLEHRKPLRVFAESLVRSGALVAVSPDYSWMGARAADLVRRIQGGERAGDIAVVPLQRMHVVLNPGTAQVLGLVVPGASRDVEVLP